MAIDWQRAIELVGGGTGVLAVVGWLIKSLVTHGLSRDAEKFRIALKSDADAEIERLKNSLQISATEHQVRFSKLHERRGEVIAEIYTKLVDVFWQGQWFMLRGGRDQRGREEGEEFNKIQMLIRDFVLFYDARRVCLSQQTCSALDEYVDRVRRATISVGVYGPISNPMSEQIQKEKHAALMES